MSPKGSHRNTGMSLTTAQRHGKPSAARHEELPQHEPSAAHGASPNQPSVTSTTHAAQVTASVVAHSAALQRPIHTEPYPEGHKPSSLKYVSFLKYIFLIQIFHKGLLTVVRIWRWSSTGRSSNGSISAPRAMVVPRQHPPNDRIYQGSRARRAFVPCDPLTPIWTAP